MGFESIGRKRETASRLRADCCPGHTNYGFDSHEWKKKQSRYERRMNKKQADGEPEEDNKQIQRFICPFCGDYDFDKIGLKHHFEAGYCEEYENTQSL